MSEVSTATQLFRIPVVREFDLGGVIARGSEEDQSKAAARILAATDLLQAELVAVEGKRRFEIADAYHRV
jgi:hypothetical protein